jgi:hypothetical protein
MQWLLAWGGECFGYRTDDNLWTYSGRHVGRVDGDEIYAPNGHYMGELRNGNRLIVNRAKRGYRRAAFAALGRRGRYARYASYAGYAMYAGCEDFPSPDTFG